MRKLSDKLTGFRCERPSEWMMDEYITDALALEAENKALKAELIWAEQVMRNYDCYDEFGDGLEALTKGEI